MANKQQNDEDACDEVEVPPNGRIELVAMHEPMWRFIIGALPPALQNELDEAVIHDGRTFLIPRIVWLLLCELRAQLEQH